jgi:hypothetical protein
MTKGRSLLLAPALLGAFWMATSRSGRGMLGQMRRGKTHRGWLGQGWLGQSWLSQTLLGRRTGSRLFR